MSELVLALDNDFEEVYWQSSEPLLNEFCALQEADTLQPSNNSFSSGDWSTSSDSGYSMESYASAEKVEYLGDTHKYFNYPDPPNVTLTTINTLPQPAEVHTTFADLIAPSVSKITTSTLYSKPSQDSHVDNFDYGYEGLDFDENLSISDLEVSSDEYDFNETNYMQPPAFQFENRDHQSNHMPDINTCSAQSPELAAPVISTQNPSFCTQLEDDGEVRHRPRTSKHLILSHFLFDALENPKLYGSMITWVDKPNGIFEFSSKNKESLAQAWGRSKKNRCPMTYQKMSRALRIYIKKGIVMKKMKRKLHYVFLPEFIEEVVKRA